MSTWHPLEGDPSAGHIMRRDDVEIFRTFSGRAWYRWRKPQEAAELRMLEREHHPDEKRLNDALTHYPAHPP